MDPVLRAISDVLATTPRVMFCAKDLAGRYTAANRTFAERAGAAGAGEVIGRTAHDLFPADLADSYVTQDEEVLATGRALTNELEFITRPDGSIGWYLTSKAPVVGVDGCATGLVSVSIDLRTPADAAAPHAGLVRVVAHIREHLADPLTVADLAAVGDMTSSQLERVCGRVLGLSPKQLVLRLRIERALAELRDPGRTIGDIAHACGYYDQSAFNRHFRRVVGMSPTAHRRG